MCRSLTIIISIIPSSLPACRVGFYLDAFARLRCSRWVSDPFGFVALVEEDVDRALRHGVPKNLPCKLHQLQGIDAKSCYTKQQHPWRAGFHTPSLHMPKNPQRPEMLTHRTGKSLKSSHLRSKFPWSCSTPSRRLNMWNG